MCRITKRLLLFAFCSLLWLAAGTSSQAEEMYQISESELTSEEQRDQAAALDRAANAADRSQSAIRDSEERADRVQELERSDAAVIRESQSILAAVRGRGKKEN